MTAERPRRASGPRAASWLLALAAGGLAATVLGHALQVRSDRRALLAQYHSLAAPLPAEVGSRISGDPDLGGARLTLARALVSAELSPEQRAARSTGSAADDLQMSLERLEIASALAAETLARRPAAWEAPLLLGSATYLSRSLPGDPRLVQSWRAWDRALTLARDLAPGKDEPHRFSVLAYLELWPVLSPEKRELTRSLVHRGLADWRTFGYLIQLWLRIAGGPEEVFAAAPDASFAWEKLASHYRQAGDWSSAIDARQRFEGSLLRELNEELSEAEEACRAGEYEPCLRAYHGAVRSARPSRRFLPVLSEVLARSPPGPAGEANTRAFENWLNWILELCGTSGCPIAETPLARLAGLSGDLPAPRRALVDLLVGRGTEAERIERQADDSSTAEWGDYWLAKAARLAAKGESGPARQALARVAEPLHSRTLYRTLRTRLGIGLDDPSGEPGEERAWHREGRTHRRELTANGEPSAVELEILATAETGAVIEVALDGLPLGWHTVRSGDTLRLALPAAREPVAAQPSAGGDWLADATAGAHHLTLSAWAGGAVRPGRVELVDSP